MPLTKTGRKALSSFRAKYGYDKGEGYFYAYIKKFPYRTRKWHRK